MCIPAMTVGQRLERKSLCHCHFRMAMELPLGGVRRMDATNTLKGANSMKDFLTKWYVKAQIFREDNGQDLIEYALVVALIAFAATVGMSTVASRINAAFGAIGNKVTSYTT